MKKMVTLMLILAICIISTAAFAVSVDFSKMTEDELLALRNQIDVELSNRTAMKAMEKGVLLEGDIDTYHVALLSVKNGVDYKGNPVAILTIMFTNNGDDGDMYITSISTKAFQNGIQLERAISVKEVDSQKQMLEVKNGASLELSIAFLLDGSGSPIEVEFGKCIDFSSKPQKLVGVFQPAE